MTRIAERLNSFEPTLPVDHFGSGFYCKRGKRAIDLAIALAAIVVVAPVGIITCAAILISSGRPILFRQQRPGLKGEPFTIIKFRTMRVSAHEDDAQRLTKLGVWLRRLSLDELPELFNVVLGDMSLVGPRPLLPQYLDRYTQEQARRHEVKPGITGLAQVNGRNALSWEEKFQFDVWYVDHCSFVLDLKILARTFRSLLRREAINQPGHATAAEFVGTPKA